MYNAKIFSRTVILHGVLDPKVCGSALFRHFCRALPIDPT